MASLLNVPRASRFPDEDMMDHRPSAILAALMLGMAPALALAPNELVGKWGLAAYFDAKDAGGIEAAARAQCHAPYTIAAGPGGGVMMHLPDSPRATELAIKGDGGDTYVGPGGDPAGALRDRKVERFDGRTLVLRWVDPTVASRYGTMVFTRCGR